ncbi:MAG: molybdopterin-synthase adenylyltransferase MoeB [Alphaproteobacteria bacterium]
MAGLERDQIERYARHILLPEIGGSGQARLLAARVLVVGAGGLGSPLILYLAAAGIGTLGIVDDDVVDLGNLQRQVIHTTAGIGTAKVASAAAAVAALNPGVRAIPHKARLDASTAAALIAAYDLVADGSDNIETRYVLNDACLAAGKPLVSASLLRFDAQISTFKPYLPGSNPCYRCLYPEPPPPGTLPSCAEAGVLGSLAGLVGSFQATEVIKELLGIGESLAGWLLLIDALAATTMRVRATRDPYCRLCGHLGPKDPAADAPA